MNERVFFRKILTTDNFFFVLAEKLDKIFPNGWIYDDFAKDGDICVAVDGTVGWDKALRETFMEFNLVADCYNYYASLDWDVSDITDGHISALLCSIVFDDDGQRIRK